MRELIHVTDHRSQLHCDECGHALPEGSVTYGPHLIGYPCPKCGSDMLTQRDFDAAERFYRWVLWVNRWFGWLGKEHDPKDKAWGSISVRHHDGKAIIKHD